MQEAKDPKSAVNVDDQAESGNEKNSDEATSSETLKDVEAETKDDESTSTSEDNRASATPSPDGQLDDARTSRDDAGPM